MENKDANLDMLLSFYQDIGISHLTHTQPLPWISAKKANEDNMPKKRVIKIDNVNKEEKGHPAQKAHSLEELKQAMASFEDCLLKHTAKNLVFADGNPQSSIMFVGEAPGRDEDLRGLPFVGRAGQLLNKMLACIGLDRTKIYITNILPWRPPDNRTPTVEEQILCEPFVRRHITLIQPRLLVCLGSISAKKLLPIDKNQGILKARGQWLPFTMESGDIIEALPMFHPAYLLRQPSQKRLAWEDLLLIKKKLESL